MITLFEQSNKKLTDDTEAKIALLYQQIGQFQFELDWLKKTQNYDLSQSKKCIDPASKLSIERQCALLGLARSSFYYTPRGESAYNLELMKLIDKQYLNTSFFGVGQFTDWLHQQGHKVNPKRVRRLLRQWVCGTFVRGHTPKAVFES
ncbi:transposase [Fibrella forsythiae]|uniref:Transposase n=1 Tax=Fibrella forsythiae TaxID=2817061 RepID=A0ABS3JRK6_9BACT|nr:transposase [Fibrella forsythiae]MBO0952631.1 transposase [Fibrella forsythiae]